MMCGKIYGMISKIVVSIADWILMILLLQMKKQYYLFWNSLWKGLGQEGFGLGDVYSHEILISNGYIPYFLE